MKQLNSYFSRDEAHSEEYLLHVLPLYIENVSKDLVLLRHSLQKQDLYSLLQLIIEFKKRVVAYKLDVLADLANFTKLKILNSDFKEIELAIGVCEKFIINLRSDLEGVDNGSIDARQI